MNIFARKIASILPALEVRGTVYLFALAEREDNHLWDVVLSSEWSDKDWPGSIRVVVDLLWPHLETPEKMMISRIAIVPSTDPTMQELPASLDGVVPSDEKVVYVSLLGSDVRRALIFKAQHPRAVSPTETLVEAGPAQR